MPTRRPRGSQTPYWSEAHHRWQVEIKLADGIKKTITSTSSPTVSKSEKHKQILAKLAEAQKLLQVGLDIDSGNQTFAEFLKEWQTAYEVRTLDSSLQTWVPYIKNLLAEFGAMKLKDIRPSHIQQWVRKQTWKASTLYQVYSFLKQILKMAVDRGYLLASPCRGIILPPVEEEEMTVLNGEHRKIFFDYLTEANHKDECLFVTALATAMRSGELRDLRWSDIDFEKKEVTVEGTVVYIRGQGYKEHKPKTKAGKRVIPLTDLALEKLHLHHAAQKARYLEVGVEWNEEALVFQGKFLGKRLSEQGIRDQLKSILAACDLPPMRVHDLRHSAITWWLSIGVKYKTAQKWAGHAKIEQTFHYTHLLPETIEEDRQLLNRAMSAVS